MLRLDLRVSFLRSCGRRYALLVLLLSPAVRLSAQRPSSGPLAHLEGRVSLSTGVPARGASVRAVCGECGGLSVDSTGRYAGVIPAGRVTLELSCYSSTRSRRVADSVTLDLKSGERRVHNFAFASGVCHEPLYGTVRGIFRGIFVGHWEGSTFKFCDEVPDMAREVLARALVPGLVGVTVLNTRAFDVLDHAGVMPNSRGETPLYVEWRGTLAGPDSYGPSGLASYEIAVDSVLTVRAMRLTDCPRINALAARTPSRFDTAAVMLAAWRAATAQPAGAGPRRVLTVTSRFDGHTVPLSPQVSKQLRERGVPIVRPVDLFGSAQRIAYSVTDVEMLPDSSVLVVLSANHFLPPTKDGLSYFDSRRDSVRVRCASGTCSADRVAPGGR